MRKVVKSGIRPVINTGIAHRSAGRGQVGAGIAHPPMACFTRALEALDALVSSRSEGAGQVANRERNPD